MLQAALLHMDATLLDTSYLQVEAWTRALLKLGQMVPRAVVHRQIGQRVDRFLPDLLDDPDAADQAQRLHDEHYGTLLDQAFLLPGAPELLQALGGLGIPIWLTTSTEPSHLGRLLARLRGANHLTGVITCHDVELESPDSTVYQVALQRAGAEPETAVAVVGTYWDVQDATAAGIPTVAVCTGGAHSAAELQAAGAQAVYADCRAALADGLLSRQ